MKQKIVFRADAGQNIGYGHFIRSMALADMLKDDFDVSFATVNPTDYQKNELSNICPFVSLNSETHFEDFLSMLQANEIVVLDNYFFTTDYQREIKTKRCKLVCIDDMHDKHYVADIVINHGIDNPALFSVEPYTRLCLGLEWALLRKPFLEASLKNRNKKHRNVIENVVVSFGGVDSYHLTDRIINMLLSEPDVLQIDAIAGKAYHSQIENNTGKSIVFHRAISAQEVASLFSNCDLAVLSASTVCLEALACGSRVAAGHYVNNQKEFYEYLKTNRFIYGLDSLSNMHSFDIHNINFRETNTPPSVCCNTSLYIEYFKTLNI
ncbi:MAG: UDP-2,4-diacetamido-2,4,6-trideoxy-beta-L-altropyranose hydrolase [Bacteroidales bacterium]|jgi:UDP-2,4-diacetamido-2,4,6-trideoxy-beta-L-altropyranose hydrolase|nr:UDP-2,4-diacetamido-2,4,6-trideoxy-beta-L-altropyranose hydrolase [Bacteroidales bacterium]